MSEADFYFWVLLSDTDWEYAVKMDWLWNYQTEGVLFHV